MAGKRYFWLKLPEDFFRRGYIRRLRSMEDGDRLALIYLEMLLAGLKTGGVIGCDGAEDPAEELALELYEDASEVETVINYMSERGKLERESESEYRLTDNDEMTGSESAAARRMRETRRGEKAETPCVSTDSAPIPLPFSGSTPPVSEEEFVRRMNALRRS